MNRGTIGLLNEMKAQHALLSMGADVLLPMGADTPYDLVVCVGGQFAKVQVKTGRRYASGCLKYKSYKGAQRTPLTPADCDVILVYCQESDAFYVARPSGLAESSILLANLEASKLHRVGQLFESMSPPEKHPGILFYKRTGTWAVQFSVDGVRYAFGSYRNYADAVLVCQQARAAIAAGEPIDNIGRRKRSGRIRPDEDYGNQNNSEEMVGDTGIEPVTLRV